MTHWQIPVHECTLCVCKCTQGVCMSGGRDRKYRFDVCMCASLCATTSYVWMHIVYQGDVSLCVCHQWATEKNPFFKRTACLRLGSHDISPTLACWVKACTVTGFSGACQGPVGANQKRQRHTKRNWQNQTYCSCCSSSDWDIFCWNKASPLII